MSIMRKVKLAVMGVSHKEATAFSKGTDPKWQHLEKAVLAAVGGYHAVLEGHKLADLVPRLDQTPLDYRSYAYEGAAMGLTGLDCFVPGKSRLKAYMAGPGAPHIYMVHIGAGEALARLRRKPEPFLARLDDPVLRWLVMDGYGFHEGFFKPDRYVVRQLVPAHLSSPYSRRFFDQGVGRSIWFASGANISEIVATISAFPQRRHADLWLGVGVACGYVGGVDRATVEELRDAAGPHLPRLSVGVAFVAKGRHRAGNPIPGTELACDVLCGGISIASAARLVDVAFEGLPSGPQPPYEVLQQRLQSQFAKAYK